MQALRSGAWLPEAPGREPSLFRVAPAGPAAAQNGTLAGCLSLPGALVLAGEMSLGDCRGDGVKTRCWLGQWKFCAALCHPRLPLPLRRDSATVCRGEVGGERVSSMEQRPLTCRPLTPLLGGIVSECCPIPPPPPPSSPLNHCLHFKASKRAPLLHPFSQQMPRFWTRDGYVVPGVLL